MRARQRVVDGHTVSQATWRAKQRILAVHRQSAFFNEDPERGIRLAKQECMFCHYAAGRLGGAAMTTAQCAICGKEKVFGNTCVDILCQDCAKKHSLCLHCGGDVDTKQRRNRFQDKLTNS